MPVVIRFSFGCVSVPLRVATMGVFLLPTVAVAGEKAPVLAAPASATALDVAVGLPPEVQLDTASRWQLVEVDHPDVAVSVQITPGLAPDGLPEESAKRLVGSIPPREGAEGSRRFTLQPAGGDSADPNTGFRLADVGEKSLGLWDGPSPVLVYNHGMITADHVPENDRRRTRSCYVHPLYGLGGEILTEDFPRDHYHHHGVFWTWPHVKIDDREFDLWADQGIKQRFVAWLGRETGPACGAIGVENGWFVDETKVMIERVWIRAQKASGDSRSIDLEFTWIPVEKAITLWGAGGKSYGGLTVRFAPPSSKDPSTLITVPSGPTTADLPETPLEWVDFTSQFGDHPTRSGAAIFVPPTHPDFPPTWLTRHYGPQCIGWPGVSPKTFPPGQPIRLSYRIWIHKAPVETAEIQRAYDAYAAASAVRWQ